MQHNRESRSSRSLALRVSAAYVVLAAVWIVASDRFLGSLPLSEQAMTNLQIAKGILFVGVSGLIIYWAMLQRPSTADWADAGIASASDSRIRFAVVMAVILLSALIFATVILGLVNSRKEVLAQTEQTTRNIARVLEEHTEGTIDAIDTALMVTAEFVDRMPERQRSDRTFVQQRLLDTIHSLPFVRAMWILDAGGDMIYDSDNLPGRNNLAEREYFQVHRDHAGTGLFVQGPLTSRIGKPFIAFSRRLSKPDGGFAGVIVAALEPDYLQQFYDSVEIGADGVVALFQADGTLVVRSPMAGAVRGQKYKTEPMFVGLLPVSRAGNYRSTSIADGVARIYAYRSVRERPLVVVVGVGDAEAFSGWNTAAIAYSIAAFAFMTLIASLGHFIVRELRLRSVVNAALRESEEHHRRLVEVAPDAIYVVDGDRIVFANKSAERMFGARDRSDLIGRSVMSLTHPEYRSLTLSRLRALDHGADSNPPVEQVFLRVDGAPINVEVASVRMHYAGKPAVQVIARDVTERAIAHRKLHELAETLERRVAARTGELEAANHALESFSYSVSHDLRAPIRRIHAFARMLAEDSGKDLSPEATDYLHKIELNALRMGQLIEGILGLSRLDRAPLTKTEVDMKSMAEDVAEELVVSEGSHAQIKVADLPRAAGDPVLVRQVWQNLIGNAIKFSSGSANASVEIGFLASGTQVEYFVKDNGVGFDMKYAEKLFREFERLHAETEFEGSGVGLAIVQRIISRHGGHIRAEGSPGQGATFYFTLPDA